MRKIFTLLFTLPFLSIVHSQTLNDGPIQLQVKVRDINTTFNATDEGVFGVGFAPDELTYKLWVRDNANLDGQGWIGGTCLQADFSPPTQSPDFNHLIFNYTYPTPTVPQFFDLKLDAWEDDLPSDGLGGFCQNGNRCDYDGNQCCGYFVFGTCIGINESDDYRCNAEPFKLDMNYRLGPPCQWYNHGYVIGSGCSDNYYQPRMESFWRYTKGTSCNDAIALGNVAGGFSPISHFNSNECYSNNFANSPGNDVFYEFNVTSPVGLKISMCANASFNTTLYLLDQNCNVMEFNDDFCALTSEINVPICTPGLYRVVVDAASAAEMGTFTLTLSENGSVIVNADAGSNLNTCAGIGANIGGNPAAFGGQPGYTYSWTPTQYIVDPTVANPVVNPPNSMYFYLTVADAANCTRTDSVYVSVLPGPNVNLGNDTTICVNGNLQLNAGPGSFYFWSNGATVSSIPVNQAGQYFVTVLDNFGCQGRDTINVSTFPDQTPNIPANSFLCHTPQAALDAGAGYTSYTWNGNPGGQTLPVTTSGPYTLNVVDNNNCSYTLTTNLTLNPLPTPNLGPDQTVCVDEAVTLNPGAGYSGYVWNTTAIDQIITVVQPGNYSVTVTDANNCQGSDQITISNYPVLGNLDLGPDVSICNNGNVTISAQSGFASYFWSTGSTQNPIQVTSSALYWVFATDNFGCVFSDTISVSVSPQINVSQTNTDNVSCFGESDGSASVSVTGGTPPLQYAWNNGSTSQNLQNVSGGVYTLTVTDANSCTESLQVIITEPAEIAALLDVTNNTCEQTNAGSIEAKIVGGVPPYSILWSTGENTDIISGLTPGQYYALITDASGCQTTDTAEVITLNINVGSDQIVVPNVFTPNGDNINDVMNVIFNITGYESFYFGVMNRWGNKVFETNTPAEYWDGGKHPDGTYFYVLKAVLNCGSNSDTIERTGTITVAR